jgi:terminase small subunit / prophage DNA-packing protein
MMMNDEVLTVNAGELAQMLGTSSRQIYNLAKRGLVVKVGRRFDLAASIRGYVAHVQGKGQNQSTIDALRTEQALLAAARRRVIEADNVPAEAIAGAWDRILRVVRSAVLAIPGRARFELPHLTANDAEAIAQICRDQLEEAALGDRPPAIDEDA